MDQTESSQPPLLSGQPQDHPQPIIHHNRPLPSSPRPLSTSEKKDEHRSGDKGEMAPPEGMEKVNIKVLVSGLKKLDLLNHLSPPSGGSSDTSPSTANATTVPTTSTPSAPTPSTAASASAPPATGAGTGAPTATATGAGALSSGGGGRAKGPMASCYEVLYQEIKLPSENGNRFREWFSAVTRCEEKDALTAEEAKNIIQFAHLHLSENPEVTRQYSITLLKKNCHLNPPTFYRLAKWSHEIRELEKHKKHTPVGGADSSVKWEAVKHCIHHGVFQNRVVPLNGVLCASCAAQESQPAAAEGADVASRTTPQSAAGGGELIRSQSSKDTRTDQSRGQSVSGNSNGGLERSASGHTLPSRESIPLKVCDRCGKPFPAMPPSGASGRQLSNRALGEGTAAGNKSKGALLGQSPEERPLASSSSGLGEARS